METDSTVASHSASRTQVKKKRLTISQKLSRDLKLALAEPDPDTADDLNLALYANYFGTLMAGFDLIAAVARHEEYFELNAVQSTQRFWNAYRRVCARPEFSRGGFVPPPLIKLAKAEVRDVWRARQSADALGMLYEDFVAEVFKLYKAAGRIAYPEPKELSGAAAIIAAIHHQDTWQL